ncbi:MAG: hypothetical protein ACOX4A_08540 [Saccharofermentanales bacterium]
MKNNGVYLPWKVMSVFFSAGVAEIGNDEGTFEELIAEGMSALAESLGKGPAQIEYISTFQKKAFRKG